MAYMSQELKKIIKVEIDRALNKHGVKMKYSLRVRNHMEIVMVVKECAIDLLESYREQDATAQHVQVNQYYLDRSFSGTTLALIRDIVTALNCQNYDNSDVQRDYFDVGYYVTLKIGEWDNPFKKV